MKIRFKSFKVLFLKDFLQPLLKNNGLRPTSHGSRKAPFKGHKKVVLLFLCYL